MDGKSSFGKKSGRQHDQQNAERSAVALLKNREKPWNNKEIPAPTFKPEKELHVFGFGPKDKP